MKDLQVTKATSEDIINMISEVIDCFNKALYETYTTDTYDNTTDTYDKEDSPKNEQEKKPTVQKPLPKRPNNDVSEKQANDIKTLVSEYIGTMVKPFCKLSDETLSNKSIELFDFAAWLLNK